VVELDCGVDAGGSVDEDGGGSIVGERVDDEGPVVEDGSGGNVVNKSDDAGVDDCDAGDDVSRANTSCAFALSI
jgi:hypothetical protein